MIPSAALLKQLGATMDQASAVLSRLTEADLLRTLQHRGLHHHQRRESGGEPGGRAPRHALRPDYLHATSSCAAEENLGFYRELDATGRVP